MRVRCPRVLALCGAQDSYECSESQQKGSAPNAEHGRGEMSRFQNVGAGNERAPSGAGAALRGIAGWPQAVPPRQGDAKGTFAFCYQPWFAHLAPARADGAVGGQQKG